MYAFGCSNAVIQVVVYPLVSKVLSSTYCNRRERVLWRSADLGDITNWDCLAAFIGYCWGMSWLYMAIFVPHASDVSTFFWVTQDILGACMCITFLGLIQLNSIQVASILLVVAFVYDIFFVFISPLIFNKSVMITVATSGGPPSAGPEWCEKYPSDKDCQGGDPLPMLLTIPKLFDYQPGSSLLGLGDIVLPGLLLSFASRLDAAKYLVALAGGTDKTRRSRVQRSDVTDDLEAVAEGEEQDGVMASSVPSTQTNSSATMRRFGSSSNAPTEASDSNTSVDSYAYRDADQVQSTLYSSWWCCLCAWVSYHCYGTSEPSAGSALLFGGGGYYFVPLCVAYAVGLLMANIAVYLMQMGQPALLYLVPCTLGSMCFLGWRRKELHSLWSGPVVLSTADKILSGRHRRRRPPQAAVAVEEGQSNTSQSTAIVEDGMSRDNAMDGVDEDGDEGDVPLLATNPKGGLVE
jgi:Signal peptide peptidase